MPEETLLPVGSDVEIVNARQEGREPLGSVENLHAFSPLPRAAPPQDLEADALEHRRRFAPDHTEADGPWYALGFYSEYDVPPNYAETQGQIRAYSPQFTADRYWADEMGALQAAVVDGGIRAEDGVWLS